MTTGVNEPTAVVLEAMRTMMQSMQSITPTLTALAQGMKDMNEERIAAKAEATAAAAASEEKTTATNKNKDDNKKTLDHHFQKKIGKFDATAKGWSDWRFQVRMAAGAADTKIVEVLNLVEKLDEELTTITRAEWEKEHELLSEKGFHLKRWSAELYEALALSSAGESLTLVRSVGELDGFEAWRKLNSYFNPTTPARALHCLLDLVNVQKVTKDTDLIMKIEEWMIKAKTAEKDFEEKISDRMQIAIITGMCSDSVRDIILQQADTYKTAKAFVEKVKMIVLNRVGSSERVPLDVGQVGAHTTYDWGLPQEADEIYETGYDEETGEINYMGPVRYCHQCGGAGHFQRECPSAPKGKGKGKGDQGKGGFGKGAKGKGFGKGGKSYGGQPQGGAWGGKGGGWKGGYQGTCFNCQEVGHKAAECTKPKIVAGVNQQQQQQPLALGRVEWDVCAIEVMQPNTALKDLHLRVDAPAFIPMKMRLGWPRRQRRKETVVNENQFEALKEEEDGEPADGVILCGTPARSLPAVAASTPAAAATIGKKKSSKRVYKKFVPNQTNESASKDSGFNESVLGLTELNLVDDKIVERKIVKGKITVDSGAAESVWPADMVREEEELEQKEGMIGFVAANGSPMQNYGRKVAKFVNIGPDADDCEKAMGFQVTDVRKPLAAVSRIVDKGNRVVFGPKPEDNYIMNIQTGKKMFMKREKGVYILDVGFLLPKDEEVPAGFTRQA